MSTDVNLFGEAEDEIPEVQIDDPVNLRPDLSEIGIIEHERGVCEDTYENRKILRGAKMGWDTVYATNGVPTGLIMARSQAMATERRMLSLAEKKPIMVDPDRPNSDYLTGLDLLAESATDYLVPPWVIGATKMWVKELEQPVASETKKPTAMPHRCRAVKDDGLRCMLWSSGRPKDDGLCRVHLRSVKKRPGEDIERARQKLTQAAPYAVDMLEDLMLNAASEPVKLKASTEILDRAGIRGGQEFDVTAKVIDGRPAAQIIAERLARLAPQAVLNAGELVDQGVTIDGEVVVSDAEIVEDNEEKATETD
jgi:hypothetical protein